MRLKELAEIMGKSESEIKNMLEKEDIIELKLTEKTDKNKFNIESD